MPDGVLMKKLVAGGWFVPPVHDRLPAARPIRGLPAIEEGAGGWFVPPVQDRLPAARPIRGLPRVEKVAGGWLVPPVDRLPVARPIRGLPRVEKVAGGWIVPPAAQNALHAILLDEAGRGVHIEPAQNVHFLLLERLVNLEEVDDLLLDVFVQVGEAGP